MTAEKAFWIPTKPYTVIDAINRCAAATGSPRYAQAADGASYNGHSASGSWNSFRGYYLWMYTWGEMVRFGRTPDMAEFIKYGKEWLATQGRGGSLVLHPRADDEKGIALLEADPDFKPWSPDIEQQHFESWPDAWKHALVGRAAQWERIGRPAYQYLLAATSPEHFEQLVKR